jgi:Tfp pilus assembly protein PilF
MLRKELDYNWPEVARETSRAYALNRRSPAVQLRCAISNLMPHGRITEALAEIEKVLQADPLSILTRWWAAVMAIFGRAFDRAADEGRHMIALEPAHFLGHWAVGMSRVEGGAPDEGAAALQKAHELSGGIPFTLGFLAYGYGRAGQRDEARRLIDLARRAAGAVYIPPSTLALGYVGLGEWDAAFEWWSQAIEVRDPLIIPIKSYPFFDPVRDDRRFQAMTRRLNLAED